MPNSGPPTRNQVAELVVSMDDLSSEMSGLHSELSRQRRRNVATMTLAGVLTVCLVVAVGVMSNTRTALHALNRERADRTTIACIYANATIKADRAAFINSLRALVPAGQELTDEQQMAIAAYTAAVEASKPYRDCSTEGIAAYYENPPVDPASGG